MTPSRNEALPSHEVFGKLHHHVMDCIKALECSEEFISTNFRASSYKPEGAKRPFFELNFQLEGYDVKTGFGYHLAPSVQQDQGRSGAYRNYGRNDHGCP